MALTDNILAYYKLDANGTDVSLVDSTGNGYTLTNTNNVALGTGKIGGCGIWEATSGTYLNSTLSGLSSQGDVSLSLWINPPNYGSGGFSDYAGSIASFCYAPSYAGWLLIFTDTGKLRVFQGSIINETTNSIPLNEWTHLAISRNANTTTLYINGVQSLQFADTADFSSNSVLFGVAIDRAGDGTLAYNGLIDEVGIWNRGLSQTVVTELYNSGAGISYPFAPPLYFNAAVNGSLTTLGNWWKDSSFTIPATALPSEASQVFISASITSGTGSYGYATINSASIGSSVSITASSITLNGTSSNAGTLVGTTTLNGSSVNSGTITGETTLNGSSYNNGTITGTATFNTGTSNNSSGVVSGNATFRGAIGNAGTVTGNAEFFDTTDNTGTVEGNAILSDSSSNAGGTIEGNATIYNPSANPIAGVVMGTETYLWPNGTGLWGGDVWIDGDIAFIIPQPSDVRSGVEYGPASEPYVGTYSGGGGANKAISISQLLKLPFPINI